MAGWGNLSHDTVRLITRLQEETGRGYADADRDGRDDATGQTIDEWIAAAEDEVLTREREQANAQRLQGNREAERYADSYEEYESSGQRTRDLDAGRDPMRRPGTGSGDSGGGAGGGGGPGEEEQWERDTRGIPIIGGPADARAAEREARRQEGFWDDLENYWYAPEDLAVDYQEEGNIEAGWDPATEAEERALAGFEDIYSHGGLTGADRARLQQGEQEMGRAMRSQREADMSQLRARGLGGSGASIGAMMSAQQSGADMLANRELNMQQVAEQRAMEALSRAGSLGGQIRQATDDYNRWNTDYSRDREQRNNVWRNRSRESTSEARRYAEERRERQTAGKTGQYSTDVSRRSGEAARNDENAKGVISAVGELIDEI
jgi:hypothetical protein